MITLDLDGQTVDYIQSLLDENLRRKIALYSTLQVSADGMKQAQLRQKIKEARLAADKFAAAREGKQCKT